MIGGGIAYALDSSVKDVTSCLMEAVMRKDTQIKPLTFSSLSGFIMIMHRPGGLADIDGNIFLRSTTMKASGAPMTHASTARPEAGLIIDTIIIKFMMMSNDELEEFTYNGEKYNKGNVTRDEVLAEQRNHMAVYSAFNSGDRQIIPSIVGNIASLTTVKTNKVLELLRNKDAGAHNAGSIIAFEYFLKELRRLGSTSRLVAIFIEKVGHDSGGDDYVVVKAFANSHIHTKTRNEDSIFKGPSPARASRSVEHKIEGRRKRNVIRAAAIGACAMQIMTMNKTKPMMLLVDAHNGNWFINNQDTTKFFAIDFGRLVHVERTAMNALYTTYLAKNYSSAASIPPPGSALFPADRFDAVYSDFETTISNADSFRIRRRSDTQRVFTNIHKCLVMAAIFDNVVTDDSYTDWNQPQMAWAYRQIWGYPESLDVHYHQPVANFPNLSIDYAAFTASISKRQLAHVERSYERLAEVIVEVNATITTGAVATRPVSTTTRPQQFFAWIGGGGGGSRSRVHHSRDNHRRTLKK